MSLNKSHLIQMNSAVDRLKHEVPTNKSWLYLHENHGIGFIRGNSLHLSSQDFEIMKLLLNDYGLNEGAVISEVTMKSRVAISDSTLQEKVLSRPVREPFVELREINFKQPEPNCYQGVHVDIAKKSHYDFIVTVENFDVFVSWNPPEYLLEGFGEKGALVYRGDTVASPKAAQELSISVPTVLHFGDFDPAGLAIAINGSNVDQIILPVLFNNMNDHSNSQKYFEQQTQARYLYKHNVPALEKYIQAMEKGELAITQERMLAFELELQLVPLKFKNRKK